MKKLAKYISIMLSMVLLVVVAGYACTGTGGAKSDPETITVAVSADPIEQTAMKNYIKSYKEQAGNENKKISITTINGNYDSWVNQQLYVNKMSDIIQVYDYSSEYWTSQNLLVPISDYMKRDNISESDYFSAIIEMAKSKDGDDNMYWVPRDYNKVVVVYNTKMFEIAGIEKPSDEWSFEDFYNVCLKLKNAKSDILSQYSKLNDFWSAMMNLDWAAVYCPVIKSYGGDILDKDNAAVWKNLDAVKTAVNKLMVYADNDLSLTFKDTTDVSSAFANKQVAMMFTARPNIPEYYEALGGDIDFVSFPRITDGGDGASYIGMGCSGYGMITACSDAKKELAWDFLKFILTEKGQETFCASGSGIPTLKKLAESNTASFRTVYPNLNNDAFVKYSERDLPMTYMKGFKPTKQLGIYSFINNNFLSCWYKEDAGTRDARYDYVSEKLSSLIK